MDRGFFRRRCAARCPGGIGGTTGKGDEGEGNNKRENQIFNHIDLFKRVLLARTVNRCAPDKCPEGYGVGAVVVVVVFLTMTLVTIILSPS